MMHIDDIIANWNECHKTTLSFLKKIPSRKFHLKPFEPRFKSFAWEFACLITTRQMYINGFKEGKLNGRTFAAPTENVEKINKEQAIKYLFETDKSIKQVMFDKEIDFIIYFGEKTSKFAVISWLMQHEQFHYGKLVLYLAQAEIKQPKSIKDMWGKNSFS